MQEYQEYYIGLDLRQRLIAIIKQHGILRVFIVRGKQSYYSCGARDLIESALDECNIERREFSDFEVNPKLEDAKRGARAFSKARFDAIIAVCGGSAIDTAKLIRHFASEGQQPSGKVPLIAIPTTAGSGAEATKFAVCYVAGEKTSVSDDAMLAEYALVYPPFTYKNTAYLTACTGFDAISHAIESWWSANSTQESRWWSKKALTLLWKQLPNLVANLDDENLRGQVAEGSYYAGRAINITTTTAAHAFSYKFTSLYGYPHGHAVALTFPFFFELNMAQHEGCSLQKTIDAQEYEERTLELLDLLHCNKDENKRDLMSRYLSSIGLATKSFFDAQLTAVINSFNEQRAANNPAVIDIGVKKRLKEFLTGVN